MRSTPIAKCSLSFFALLAATSLLPAFGTAQQDYSTGFIRPPAKIPNFVPETWNQAYQLTLQSVPLSYSSNDFLRSLTFPNTMVTNVQFPQECSTSGYESTSPAITALGACFSRRSSNTTVDLWVKLPGLALVMANCYCYALDLFEGASCQPGAQSGAASLYMQRMTCSALSNAIISDGAEAVSRQQALAGQPSSGHYIAVLARPESCIKGHCYEADFHAVRKDSSGTWSWKHPGMSPSNRDLFGALVTDPEAAALMGNYQLCGYFKVHPQQMAHVVSSSVKEKGPLPVNPAVLSLPGVHTHITPLPYNPASDTILRSSYPQSVEEDIAWQRQRSSEQYKDWVIREKKALGLLPRGTTADSSGVKRDSSNVLSAQPASITANTAEGLNQSANNSKAKVHRRLFGSSVAFH